MSSYSKKTLTFEEVEKHNVDGDCWLIIHGKVYDVSPYMNDHPGGTEILLATTAKDGTMEYEDIGHSEEAKEMKEKYYIGEIDESTLPLTYKKKPRQQPNSIQNDKNSDGLNKILLFLVPLLIVGLAFAARHFTKQD